LNRYAYVQNDPVNFVDPTGLFAYLGVVRRFNDPSGGAMLGAVTGSNRRKAPISEYELRRVGGGPQNPAAAQLPPCDITGSGDIGGELITPVLIGPKGGVQLNKKGIYPYFGLAAGIPGRGPGIMAGPSNGVSPGLNAGFSFGAALAISYSAHIDWHTNLFRSLGSQLRNGTWQFGGQKPGASVNVTVVLAPKFLQKNCQ
jgi:uncharacterized protein RhaS with RHS repeats